MNTALVPRIDLALHPKQGEAFLTQATEVLYGGAAGGGKSHLMRVAAITWCAAIPGLQVYLFRRKMPDLIKNHMEGPKGFRSILSPWVNALFVDIVEAEVRFWNGSKIYLCHCKDERDRYNYDGAEMHVLLIDELTHFTEKIYRFLRGRVRKVGLNVPPQYEGLFPRIVASSNPGKVGHLFVKATFIDNVEPMVIRDMPPSEGGMRRQFIPARLDDNPSMTEDDPHYRERLSGLGSETLVRAYLEGDWNIIEGAFFECWDPGIHVVQPFAIPAEWPRIRSLDWGSARPFSAGWFAVSDGRELPDGRIYPAGAMIKYREWYGCKRNEDGSSIPNVGLKMTAEEVAAGIVKRQPKDERYSRSVADPSIFSEDGGPSIAQRMIMKNVVWSKADNARVPRSGHLGGWDQMRARLIGEDGKPMLYYFSTCYDSIRTVPALQHDESNPEDIDTNGEDHVGDSDRYALMSRPYFRVIEGGKAAPDRWDKAFEDQEEETWRTA